jgi:hypothetical protein
MNVCLNLSGKIILGDNETLLDKINHFKKYINFDKIYMHIWADDYIKYFNEIQFIKNCSVIVVTPPIIDENYYCPHFLKIKTPYEYKAHSNVFQFYGLQCVFQQSCLEDNDIHIRCRYDNILYKYLDMEQMTPYLDCPNPVAIAPYGSDWHHGLGDVFYILNRSAAQCMKSYFYDVVEMCKSNVPFHPESLLRNHFVNDNKFKLYRMSYPVTINGNQHYFQECFLNNLIVEDKLYFISEFFPK